MRRSWGCVSGVVENLFALISAKVADHTVQDVAAACATSIRVESFLHCSTFYNLTCPASCLQATRCNLVETGKM